MSITHIVLIQFKADISAEVIKDVCQPYPNFSPSISTNTKYLLTFGKGLLAHARPERHLRASQLPAEVYQIRSWRGG